MIIPTNIWNKSIDLLLSIKNLGAADSKTLKRRLDINDREFYPAIRPLIAAGYVSRRRAFVGERLLVKQFYFLTEDGERLAKSEREGKGKEIQIQG